MAASSSPTRAEAPAPVNDRIQAAAAECSSAAAPPSRPPLSLPRQASSIARQASIYSLTLDDLQNTLSESKPLGSMNMDEFLKNIWTAEESQAMAVAIGSGGDEAPPHAWQNGALHQGSVSLARTLSRKTVEDVWREIASAGGFNMGLCSESAAGAGAGAGAGQERQVTLAEMTLEDFLMKVGVVMKDNTGHSMQSGAPFESRFDNGNGIEDKLGHCSALFGYKDVEDEKPNIKDFPMLSLSAMKRPPRQTDVGADQMQAEALKHLSPHPQPLDWLTSHSFKNATMASHQLPFDVSQHMMESNSGTKVNGPIGLGEDNHMGPDVGVGYAAVGLPPGIPSPLTIKAGSPTSPLSEDDVGPSHGSMSSISPLSYKIDGVVVGRKRGFDGSLEKVVERRQRRMIKNRESAARSRARKQAYTVELEAEVMQLKEENMRLRLLQEEMADMRRKQFLDVLASLGSQYMAPKGDTLRRTRTVPW